MYDSERFAKKLLLEEGHKIRYNGSRNPDFETVDGSRGFEIKVMKDGKITISLEQFIELKQRGNIELIVLEIVSDIGYKLRGRFRMDFIEAFQREIAEIKIVWFNKSFQRYHLKADIKDRYF